MKPLIPVLIVATTSLAVASVQFHQQASAQRKRADAEAALRQKQEIRVAQLEHAQARLERQLQMAQRVETPAAPAVAATEGAELAQRAIGQAASGKTHAVEGSVVASRPGVIEGIRPHMPDSPAARNVMRSRIKLAMRRSHQDVGRELGLSTEKANELIDLLADQQMRDVNRPLQLQDPKSYQQYVRDTLQKNEAQIAALIGQDKLDEWADYQKSLPYRAQVDQVGEQLDGAGVPMTDSQRKEMIAAVAEETERVPRPAYSAGIPQEEMRAQVDQWRSDYEKALLERAKQVLSTEQYNSYKEYQDYQTEMRNSIARSGARFRAVGAGGVPPPASVVSGASTFFYATPPMVAPLTPEQPDRK